MVSMKREGGGEVKKEIKIHGPVFDESKYLSMSYQDSGLLDKNITNNATCWHSTSD